MDLFKTALWFILLFFSVGKLNCTATPRFVLYIQSNMKGGLNCFNTQNSKFENVEPEVNFPNIKSLTISSCQLLKTPLLHQLINDLGIERLNASTIVRLEFNFKNNNKIALSLFRFNWFDLENFNLDDFEQTHKLNNISVVDVTEATVPIELLQNLNQNNTLLVTHLDVIKNLANLEISDLNHNKIKILTMRQFSNLKQVKYVNLSSNEIDHIYFTAFDDNNVEVIDLQNNPISELPPDLFAQFLKLLEVNLRNCTLRNLSSSLFHKSESLKSIDLSSNEITFIQETAFDSLKDLRYLDLSSNKLKELPKYSLRNLQNLKHLNLSYNNLIRLENFAIYLLYSLEELDLKYNDLTSIHFVLKLAKNVSYLNLSHNRLKEFLLYSVSLKKIDLSNNKLKYINEFNYFQSENKTCLDASFQQIIAGVFELNGLLKNVGDIHIVRQNRIHLDAASFNKTIGYRYNDIDFFLIVGPHLETLNLSNNRISSMYFCSMQGLTIPQHLVIDLDNNSVDCDCKYRRYATLLPEALDPITAKYVTIKTDNWVCGSTDDLKNQLVQNLNPETLMCPYYNTISQHHNRHSYLCPKFCTCYARQWKYYTFIVDCENKNLTKIPILNFPPNTRTVEVNLRNNFLKYGPQDRMGYEKVTQLLLSHNNIAELTWTPPLLKTIMLDHNNFTVFDSKMWELLNSSYLLNVTLGGNPWICSNCSTKIFQKYLSTYKDSKLMDVENIMCTESEMINGTVDGLCELSYSDIFAGLVLVLLLICIITC